MPGAQKKKVASTCPMKIFPNVIAGVVEEDQTNNLLKDQTNNLLVGMEILVAKI